MSTGNLELAERFIEVARRRDWRRLDLLSEDLVYRPIAEITEAGEYHGPERFCSYMEQFFESEWAQDLDYAASFREYGDTVIVRIQFVGRGRASELDFTARVFQVLTFADGQIVRIDDFTRREEALAAAGVGSETD